MRFSSSYMDMAFNPENLWCIVKGVNNWVKHHQDKYKFDAIAFRGMSGAAVAFPVSYETKIPLICVRKEGSHAFSTVEGAYQEIASYIILDDFINTGETVKEIIERINQKAEQCHHEVPVCVGILLYRSTGWKSATVRVNGKEVKYTVWETQM